MTPDRMAEARRNGAGRAREIELSQQAPGAHVCYSNGMAWQSDHPLPVENPDKLTGPLLGTVVRYVEPRYPQWDGLLVRVKARSYVWSPGECSANGGYRHYDWTVIEWPVLNRNGSLIFKTMVVDDDTLEVL